MKTNHDVTQRSAYTLKDVPDAPLPLVLDSLYQDEYGDALLFAHLLEGKCVYDHSDHKWFIWNKHYWKRDDTKGVYTLVMGLLPSVYLLKVTELNLQIKRIEENGSEEEKDEQKKMKEQVKKLQARARLLKTKTRMMNVLELATSQLGVTGDKWDTLTNVLPTPGGIVDLKTGKMRAGKPEDYVRTVTNTRFTGIDTP